MRVEFLGLADQGTFETRPVPELELTLEGIPGDRHAGLTMRAGVRQDHLEPGTVIRNARHLSLVGSEELAEVALALGLERLAPEWFGANVVLSGMEALTRMAPSTRLVFASGAVVVIDGDNTPCVKTGRAVERGAGAEGLHRRFVKAAAGRRGLVGWVECPGLVRVGDAVTVVPR